MKSINISYKELKYLLEQKLGERINYLYIPARSTIDGGLECILYEVTEKMGFTEKKEGFYTRETPNFIATLTKAEKHIATINYATGTYAAWILETRAYKETIPMRITSFATEEIKSHNDEEQYKSELIEYIKIESHNGRLWNGMEEIKKESERILEESRYW
jgi:hypothetical protein